MERQGKIARWTDGKVERQRNRELERQRYNEMDRKTERQTGRTDLSCTHASGKTFRIRE
jgi:hypothetical protein